MTAVTRTPAAYRRLSRFRSELMGFAALWVMLFHAYPFTFKIAILDQIKEIGFTGVDIFILLSAMGLYVSLSKPEADSLGRFYVRRLVRVLPAYWLVVGCYSLFLVRTGSIGWSTALWNLSTLHYWFHIPDSFNWYIPSLLAFYLLAPFYVKLFRRCPWKAALTAAVFPVSYGLYRLSIPPELYYTQDFVCRLPAFALGILMGYYLTAGQPLTRRHAAVWAALSLAGLIVIKLCMEQRMYISPCYRIASQLVPLCLLLALAAERLPPRLQAFLRLLGGSSLEIYLLNVILTREFSRLAPFLDRGPRHLFYYAVTYSANLLLGIALHRLLVRLIPPFQGPHNVPPERQQYSHIS